MHSGKENYFLFVFNFLNTSTFLVVLCEQCEVEGVLPNVTVTLALPPNGSPLQDILVHPCVTSLDSSILTASSVDNCDGSAFSGPYKFPFSPPLEPFRLCSYTSQVKHTNKYLSCHTLLLLVLCDSC